MSPCVLFLPRGKLSSEDAVKRVLAGEKGDVKGRPSLAANPRGTDHKSMRDGESGVPRGKEVSAGGTSGPEPVGPFVVQVNTAAAALLGLSFQERRRNSEVTAGSTSRERNQKEELREESPPRDKERDKEKAKERERDRRKEPARDTAGGGERERAKNRPRPGRDRDAERERERKVEAGKEKERGKGRERERRRARDGEHARDPDREKSREHDRPEKVGPAWEPPPFAPLCCPPKGPWSSCVTREVAFSVPDSKP